MNNSNPELQAALLSAISSVYKKNQELKIGNYCFGSDSTIVHHWMRTLEMQYQIFVANSLAEFSVVSLTHNGRYIASSDNPADDGSRGY